MSSDRPPVREMIKNAVGELGGKASKNQIVQWISKKYGDVNHNTIRTQANACSVNQPSRIHLPECGKPRSFDPRYDFARNFGRILVSFIFKFLLPLMGEMLRLQQMNMP